MGMIVCSFCGREVPLNKRHHLIPRMKHNNRMKRLHTKEELMAQVDSCPSCHKQVHAIFTEKELAETFNTVAKLLEHPEIRKFVDWIATKPADFGVRSRQAVRRR